LALGSTPAVAGATERWKAIRRAIYYTCGSALGGVTLGLAASVVEYTTDRPAEFAVVAVVSAYGGAAMIRTWRPPQRHWQVPRSWWTRWRNGAFLVGGFTLALGFLTPIYFWSYFVFVTLLATLTPPLAGVVGALYGLVRSIPTWRAATGPVFCGVVQPVRISQCVAELS